MTDHRFFKIAKYAAVLILLTAVVTAAFFCFGGYGFLELKDAESGRVYGRYLVRPGQEFSIGFIHSVNKSPVTDVYEVRRDGIYVVRTIYYGFGAGVQTELEEGQTLEYGEDGSMIISGFNRKLDPLTYFVGTVSDHILTIEGRKEISLRTLCGRNAMVSFRFSPLLRG